MSRLNIGLKATVVSTVSVSAVDWRRIEIDLSLAQGGVATTLWLPRAAITILGDFIHSLWRSNQNPRLPAVSVTLVSSFSYSSVFNSSSSFAVTETFVESYLSLELSTQPLTFSSLTQLQLIQTFATDEVKISWDCGMELLIIHQEEGGS